MLGAQVLVDLFCTPGYAGACGPPRRPAASIFDRDSRCACSGLGA
jgi:hypothetical protein